MNIELDEVYVASIKEMFKEFDNEIIWTAIFEHGYQFDGSYQLENVVNYLLELSNNQTNSNITIPSSNITPSNIPSSNITSNNKNTNILDLDEDLEEATELEPNLCETIVDIFKNNKGYKKLKN
tara:strand:+ start:108 stop:479 length:372 start_codon:yes stop_codon:yes gene_type:complete